MFSLSWDIEELEMINSEGHRIYEDLEFCSNLCSLGLFQQHIIASKLTSIRQRLCSSSRGQPISGGHELLIFVLMISSELRDNKLIILYLQTRRYKYYTLTIVIVSLGTLVPNSRD